MNLCEEVVDEQSVLRSFSVGSDELEDLSRNSFIPEVRLVCGLDLPADSYRRLRAFSTRDLRKAFLSLCFILHLVNVASEVAGLARET